MRGSLWSRLLGAAGLGAACAVAAPFTQWPGVLAAGLGALAGLLGGPALARTRVRTGAIPLLGLGLALAGAVADHLLNRWAGPSLLVGSRGSFLAGEALAAGALALAVAGTLAALAERGSAWKLVGLGLLATLFTRFFAGHWEGFVNRPFAFVDPLWSRGVDPLPWFLVLGLALVVLAAAILAGRGAGRRTLAGLGVLVALLALVLAVLPQRRLRDLTDLHRGQGGQPAEQPPQPAQPQTGGEPEPGQGPNRQDLAQDFTDQAQAPSDAALAVVVFHTDYDPPAGMLYFREAVFSGFNGERLVKDVTGRFDPPRRAPGPGGTVVRTTMALLAPHPAPVALVDPLEIRPTGNPDPRRFHEAHLVRSWAPLAPPRALLAEPAGDPAWGPEAWTHFTAGPADPRYKQLADRIVEGLRPEYRKAPFARALAIKLWLDANTTYTLATAHGASPEPVSDFLFGDLRGHCVYLAHAAALLYRAAGVPARVAGGYAAESAFRRGGASLLLRARDAHAWPEVHLASTGWIPLDISPARSDVPPAQAPDADLQRMLGQMATQEQPTQPPPPEEDPAPLVDRAFPYLRLLGRLLLALLILALPAAYLVKAWRRWIPWGATPARVPRLAYRAALDLLAARGLRRTRGEHREAFALRVGAVAPSLGPLTDLHLRAALGAPGGDPRRGECLALLRAVRREAALAPCRVPRWLRALHPLPWYLSR